MPREGRQGHPAESFTKPSLQNCNTWVQSSLAFALMCVKLHPDLFHWCWTHPFPPLEQLWYLSLVVFMTTPIRQDLLTCSFAHFWEAFYAMMNWRLHFTQCKEHKNAWGFHFLCTGRSCFPFVFPLLLFPVCLLWWTLAPLGHARLEEEEAKLQKQLLKTQMSWWERRKLGLACDEYLDCLIISFLRKNTSESNIFCSSVNSVMVTGSQIFLLSFFKPVTCRNRLWTKSPWFEESFLLPIKANTWARGLLLFRYLSYFWETWNDGKVFFCHHKWANLLRSSRRYADDEFHRKSGAQLWEPGLLFHFYNEDIQKIWSATSTG